MLGGKSSFHQNADDGLDVDSLEIGVRLTGADEDDGLPGDVRHRNSSADLWKKNIFRFFSSTSLNRLEKW